MKFIRTFEQYKFSDIFPKNKWVQLSDKDREELKSDLWYIVDNAYGPLGGHVRIKDSDSIYRDKELSFWKAIDIDDDPYSDVVIFGRNTKYGFKISGWGHDGESTSKKELMSKLAELLSRDGFWIEVSGRPAEILLKKYHVNYINSFDKIKTIFPDTNIEWLGLHPSDDTLFKYKGFYKRVLEDGSDTEIEIVLGNPKI